MLRPGSLGEVSGFQTIATCRDGLKNSRDKSATSPFASGKRGSRRGGGQINGDVTGLSWICRGRHGEVGIMESGLNKARVISS